MRALWIALFAAGFSLVGCTAQCHVKADCGADQTCFAGSCRPFAQTFPPCSKDDDCALGLRCSAEGCRVRKVACGKVADCRVGEACTGGHCVDSARSCTDDKDCVAERPTCEFNRCVSSVGCVDTRDCAMGDVCRDARCVESLSGCDVDDDCEEGTCEDGACVQ